MCHVQQCEHLGPWPSWGGTHTMCVYRNDQECIRAFGWAHYGRPQPNLAKKWWFAAGLEELS